MQAPLQPGAMKIRRHFFAFSRWGKGRRSVRILQFQVKRAGGAPHALHLPERIPAVKVTFRIQEVESTDLAQHRQLRFLNFRNSLGQVLD